MAINPNHLPAPTEPSPGLRSYREAASYLAENERRISRGARGESPPPCPTEPREPTDKATDQPPRASSRSSSPKAIPKAKPSSKAKPIQKAEPSPDAEPSPKAKAQPSPKPTAKASPPCTATARCRRSRTPSPPHPAPSSRGEPTKAPRSVSPGGTPACCAPAALRKSTSSCGARAVSPEPRRVSWPEALVTSVITRPRTLRKDVAELYYSRADEKRFRKEAAFAVDDEPCDAPEASPYEAPEDPTPTDQPTAKSDFTDQPTPVPEDDSTSFGLWSPTKERRDYAISKAVVIFGDATLTYGAAPAVVSPCAAEASSEEPFSFDDAAFWNGRLTWS